MGRNNTIINMIEIFHMESTLTKVMNETKMKIAGLAASDNVLCTSSIFTGCRVYFVGMGL